MSPLPPTAGAPTGASPSPASCQLFLLADHSRRHMQGQWHMEGVAPAAQAGWLCCHTVTRWPQLTPVSRMRGDCTPGAACLCSKPHHSPVTDQDPLPTPEASALALSPVCPPGPTCSLPCSHP